MSKIPDKKVKGFPLISKCVWEWPTKVHCRVYGFVYLFVVVFSMHNGTFLCDLKLPVFYMYDFNESWWLYSFITCLRFISYQFASFIKLRNDKHLMHEFTTDVKPMINNEIYKLK